MGYVSVDINITVYVITTFSQAKLERLQSEASELSETIQMPLNGSILPPCQHSTEVETLRK